MTCFVLVLRYKSEGILHAVGISLLHWKIVLGQPFRAMDLSIPKRVRSASDALESWLWLWILTKLLGWIRSMANETGHKTNPAITVILAHSRPGQNREWAEVGHIIFYFADKGRIFLTSDIPKLPPLHCIKCHPIYSPFILCFSSRVWDYIDSTQPTTTFNPLVDTNTKDDPYYWQRLQKQVSSLNTDPFVIKSNVFKKHHIYSN